MRVSSRWITLLGGLGLVVLALVLIVVVSVERLSEEERSGISESAAGNLLEYRDDRFAVRFLYPTGWQVTEQRDDITVRPPRVSGTTEEPATLFVISRGEYGPEAIQDVNQRGATQRRAENVAVGGMSGTESVVEIGGAGTTSSVESRVASTVREEPSQSVTVIVWSSQRANDPLWVIMRDEQDSPHLTTLQGMRNSVRWE